jgi:hypothetical protein
VAVPPVGHAAAVGRPTYDGPADVSTLCTHDLIVPRRDEPITAEQHKITSRSRSFSLHYITKVPLSTCIFEGFRSGSVEHLQSRSVSEEDECAEDVGDDDVADGLCLLSFVSTSARPRVAARSFSFSFATRTAAVQV